MKHLIVSVRLILSGVLVGASLLFVATPARAQGCVVARLFAPQLVSPASASPAEGQWQVSATYRYFHSFRDFQGSKELPVPAPPELFASTRVSTWDVSASYGIKPRLALTAELPVQHATRETSYEHAFVTNHTMTANGIGDLRLVANMWVHAPTSTARGNASFGIGLKLPTGKHDAADISFRDTGNVSRPVDPAIQLGDGGVGIILTAQGFAVTSHNTVFFGQGTYLLNPRETNGTQAPFGDLPDFTLGDIGYTIDSVPDQFVARAGVAQQITRALSLNLSMRIDGVPAHDLLGGSEGYRLPGYSVALEPGLTLTRGANTISWTMPFAVRRHATLSIADIRTGNPIGGIAALADHVLNLSFSRRF